MKDRFLLALAHIRYYSGRTTLLVLIFALLIAIPVLGEQFSRLAEQQLVSRADETPLVYAAPGSQLDATLGALFFKGNEEAHLAMADYEALLEMDLGLPLPVLLAGTAQGFPVVSTDPDYFGFRKLHLSSGRNFVHIGDAVLGARVAEALTLSPGDRLKTDSTRIFELAGSYPVRLNVAGVLTETGGADDYAVFTGLRTGWVAKGLGHGHQELGTDTDDALLLSRDDDVMIANARLTEFIDFTEENRSSFHFHGSTESFPLSSIIVVPQDARSAAFIQGRVADRSGQDRQIFRPTAVVLELLDDVFRIGTILKVLIAVVSVAALLAVAMVVSFSLKMRRREFEIARQIGADRFAVAQQVLLEFATVLLIALVLCALLFFAGHLWGDVVFNTVFLGLIA